MDSIINITAEGSQNEYHILTTLKGDVNQSEYQQIPRMSEKRVADDQHSATALDRAVETPYTSVKVLLSKTSEDQPLGMSRLNDEPRRIQRAREESQEDALDSVRHFFAPGNGQEQAVWTRSINETPTTTGSATIETYTITTTPLSLLFQPPQWQPMLEQQTPALFFPMGSLLDPLQLLPVDHRCGYREFQRVRLVCLPMKILSQVRVIFMHPLHYLRKRYQKNLGDEWRIYIPLNSLE